MKSEPVNFRPYLKLFISSLFLFLFTIAVAVKVSAEPVTLNGEHLSVEVGDSGIISNLKYNPSGVTYYGSDGRETAGWGQLRINDFYSFYIPVTGSTILQSGNHTDGYSEQITDKSSGGNNSAETGTDFWNPDSYDYPLIPLDIRQEISFSDSSHILYFDLTFTNRLDTFTLYNASYVRGLNLWELGYSRFIEEQDGVEVHTENSMLKDLSEGVNTAGDMLLTSTFTESGLSVGMYSDSGYLFNMGVYSDLEPSLSSISLPQFPENYMFMLFTLPEIAPGESANITFEYRLNGELDVYVPAPGTQPEPVPEPGTFMLLAAGIFPFLGKHLRRRFKKLNRGQ